MSRRITTLDDAASVSLPPEAVDALGVHTGDELDIEIVGRALVVRSADEARRSRSFADVFESVLKKRRDAYERLAEGPG
jgi:antitoxin component of MazEF toxin-antitoxin module